MTISKEIETHFRTHMVYPATKKAILESCSNLSDLSNNERGAITKLPDRKYTDAEDAIQEFRVAMVEN